MHQDSAIGIDPRWQVPRWVTSDDCQKREEKEPCGCTLHRRGCTCVFDDSSGGALILALLPLLLALLRGFQAHRIAAVEGLYDSRLVLHSGGDVAEMPLSLLSDLAL